MYSIMGNLFIPRLPKAKKKTELLVSDLILIKKLTKLQPPALPKSWDTGASSPRLSLEIKTQKFLFSDSVSISRLEKFQSQNWHSENVSLELGLKTETQKIWVADSVLKLRFWKFHSQTWSWNWDSENLSLRRGLKIETLKIPVLDLCISPLPYWCKVMDK